MFKSKKNVRIEVVNDVPPSRFAIVIIAVPIAVVYIDRPHNQLTTLPTRRSLKEAVPLND